MQNDANQNLVLVALCNVFRINLTIEHSLHVLTTYEVESCMRPFRFVIITIVATFILVRLVRCEVQCIPYIMRAVALIIAIFVLF